MFDKFGEPFDHPNNKIMLALHNVPDLYMCKALAEHIGSHIHGVTINSHFANDERLDMSRREGFLKIIDMLRNWDITNIFYDESLGRDQPFEKVLDIARDVDYLSIDATLGVEGMNQAVEARDSACRDSFRKAKLIATTVLPHEPEQTVRRTYRQSIPELVENLTEQSLEAGMDGVAHSWHELGVTQDFGLLRVVSGLRLVPLEGDEQARVMNVADVGQLADQPDIIIVGSAVTRGHEYYEQCLEPFGAILDGLKIPCQ